jgi:hypothetical protein
VRDSFFLQAPLWLKFLGGPSSLAAFRLAANLLQLVDCHLASAHFRFAVAEDLQPDHKSKTCGAKSGIDWGRLLVAGA